MLRFQRKVPDLNVAKIIKENPSPSAPVNSQLVCEKNEIWMRPWPRLQDDQDRKEAKNYELGPQEKPQPKTNTLGVGSSNLSGESTRLLRKWPLGGEMSGGT